MSSPNTRAAAGSPSKAAVAAAAKATQDSLENSLARATSTSCADFLAPSASGLGTPNGAAGKIEQQIFHDELVGHGRVTTWMWSVRSYAIATFERNSKSVVKNYIPPCTTADDPSKEWLRPLRTELLTWLKRMSDSLDSDRRPSRLVDRVVASCESACREVHEEDSFGGCYDRLLFYCGSVVFQVELEKRTLYAPVWTFENDYKSFSSMQKMDAMRVERLYLQWQRDGSRGTVGPVKGAFGREYVYDFEKMSQTNSKSSKSRALKRVAPLRTLGDSASTASWAEVIQKKEEKKKMMAEEIAAASAGGGGAAASAPPQSAAEARAKIQAAMEAREQMRRGAASGGQRESAAVLARETHEARKLLAELDESENRFAEFEAKEAERQKQEVERKLALRRKQKELALARKNKAAADAAAAAPCGGDALHDDGDVEDDTHSSNNTGTTLPGWLSAPEFASIPLDILEKLHAERVDESTFLLLSSGDLAGLGIPLGPRLALMQIVEAKKNNSRMQSSSEESFTAVASSTGNSMMMMDQDIIDLQKRLQQQFRGQTLILDPADVELLAPIQSGGMGTVFEALCAGRPVAAKLFDDLDNGFDEAKHLVTMHHRNIINVVGVSVYCPKVFARPQTSGGSFSQGRSGGGGGTTPASPTAAISRYRAAPRMLMLLELADGNLNNLLQQSAATLSFDLAVRYCMQIAQALEYCHARVPRVIHRDIKPSNLLLLSDGLDLHLKLCDFGVSRASAHTVTAVTHAGVGSNFFCAPEQMLSTECSAAADIYALGVIFVWFACGKNVATFLPQDRRACAEQAPGLLQEALKKPRPETPAWFVRLASDCVQRDPLKRPQDGAAVVQRIMKECADMRMASTSFSNSNNTGATGDDDAKTEVCGGVTLTGW